MTFSGPDNHEEVLSQFMDLSVLPQAVSPQYGRGRAAEGMPQRFEGGIAPAEDDCDTPLSSPPPDATPMKTNHATSRLLTPTTTMSFDFDEEEDEQAGRVTISARFLAAGSFHLDDLTGNVSAVQPCAY